MKVISFSLYGDNPIYTIGAVNNAKLKKTYFKDWAMWVYHNNSVPVSVLNELSALNVRLINMRKNAGFFGSLWRFNPISDQKVEHFISRDCDSRLSIRDEIAVNEWISSGKKFHIIRDHPEGHWWAINAGMWGAKGGSVLNFSELVNTYIQKNNNKKWNRVMDQYFLKEVIYEIAVSDLFLHDEFFNYEGIGTNIKRDRSVDDFAFIGEIIDEYNFPKHNFHRTMISKYFENKPLHPV